MFIDVDVELRIHKVIIVLSQGGNSLCLHTSAVTVFVLVAISGSDSSGKFPPTDTSSCMGKSWSPSRRPSQAETALNGNPMNQKCFPSSTMQMFCLAQLFAQSIESISFWGGGVRESH